MRSQFFRGLKSQPCSLSTSNSTPPRSQLLPQNRVHIALNAAAGVSARQALPYCTLCFFLQLGGSVPSNRKLASICNLHLKTPLLSAACQLHRSQTAEGKDPDQCRSRARDSPGATWQMRSARPGEGEIRGPKGHINTRILHNMGFWTPSVIGPFVFRVVCLSPYQQLEEPSPWWFAIISM